MKKVTLKFFKPIALCLSLVFILTVNDAFATKNSQNSIETHQTSAQNTSGPNTGQSADHDPHTKKGLPQLDQEKFPGQIFWLFVSFGLLYVLFTRRSLAKVTEIKTEREIRSDRDLQVTEELRREATKLKHDYEDSLNKARVDAKTAYQQTNEKLQKQSQNEKKLLQETLRDKIDSLSVEISDLKQQSKEEIQKIAEELTGQIVKKLSGKAVDKATIKAKIAEAMNKSKLTA